MYFPGADYKHYWVCNDNRDTRLNLGVAADAGVHRYIVTNAESATKNYNNILKTESWSEIAFLYGPKPFRLLADGSKELVGMWDLGESSELEPLREQVENHRYIFIRTKFTNQYFSKFFRRKFADKVQWIYEFQRDNPDKHLIVWGNFEFETMFSMGMHGSGMKYNRSMNRLVWLPNGRTIEKYEIVDRGLGEFNYLIDKWPDKSAHFVAIKMWLMIPEWIKEFYSIKPLPELVSAYNGAGFLHGYYFKNSRLRYMHKDLTRRQKAFTGPGRSLPDSINEANKRILVTDRILCDTCSLAYACKLYRKRGACVVDGTEGSRLAKLFKSTNAEDIMEGMAEVLGKQAELVDASITNEMRKIRDGDQTVTSKDLNTQINDLFKNSAKMAVLRNPDLTRPKTAIQINNSNGSQGQIAKTEKIALEITSRDKAQAIRELEAQGVDRGDMDSDMIIRHIHDKMNKQTLQLEGEVIEGEVVTDVEDVF